MSNIYFRGDNIFLYAQFLDEKGNPCVVENPQVRILHDKNGTIYEDLQWTKMNSMSENEFFYNFEIPFVSDLGQYQVIYMGTYNGNVVHTVETFYLITQSEKYENTIKIYGYVNDIRVNIPLSDVMIKIINSETQEIVFQSLTNDDGFWEAFIYPGEYVFMFNKVGFILNEINVQIGDEYTELQFNNVSLESEKYKTKGNGLYLVTDKYTTKQGVPLTNLNIKISNVYNPSEIISEDYTNNEGEWQAFLDPGNYMLKVTGIALSKSFNKVFRIKVEENGSYAFEDLAKNVIKNKSTNLAKIDTGNGSIVLTDCVKDKNGNAIVDVQVNAFKAGSQLTEDNIIAQDYTDIQGNWKLNLNPGNYVIEYYHPQFKVITEKRTV